MLIAAGNRPSGFDVLRIALAVAVVLWHSFTTSYGSAWAHSVLVSPLRPLIYLILPAFFSLSGFLVAGSLERSSLMTFIGLRVIRIVPALVVETVISAFILGALLTTLPLAAYFSHPVMHRYLLNIIGIVHYQLPGVFLHNPIADIVNGQLWTVPWELRCYIALVVLALLRLDRNRHVFLGLGCVVPIAYVLASNIWWDADGIDQLSGRALVLSFLCGVALFKFRDRISHNGLLFAASLLAFAALVYARYGEALLCIPASYITVYLGTLNGRRPVFLMTGDYSYGIFLYGYAVQQFIASLGPALQVWYVNFSLAGLLILIAAAVSWHVVERPALALRRYFPRLETAIFRMGRRLRA